MAGPVLASRFADHAKFFYSPDRKAEHPRRHLENYTGILQADLGFADVIAPRRVSDACYSLT